MGRRILKSSNGIEMISIPKKSNPKNIITIFFPDVIFKSKSKAQKNPKKWEEEF